jgi:hypothetical protein
MPARTRSRWDLRRELREFYTASPSAVKLVDVPALKFLRVDGTGGPDAPEFALAIQMLFNLAYTIRFTLKAEQGLEYPVLPLEAQWVLPTGNDPPDPDARSKMGWTLLLMVPDVVTARILAEGVERVRRKGRPVTGCRLWRFREGRSAQTLHVGPYSGEAASMARLLSFLEGNGWVPRGKHHEIYIGDPRRSRPERLRTILRTPVRPA